MNPETLLQIRNFVTDLVLTGVTLVRMPVMCRPVKKFPLSEKKEALILGNGPGVKDFLKNHMDFLENKEIWAVNQMAATEVFEQIKPEKYLVSAPEYWTEDVDENYQRWTKELFESLKEKTTWPMDFFIPVSAKNKGFWYDMIKQNPHISIVYYNKMPVEGFRWFRYGMYKMRLGMPRPHNVIIPSLMNAILTGYGKIYLIGVEHNWLKTLEVGEDNTVYLVQEHFYYDEISSNKNVMKKFGKLPRKMHEILEKFYLSFKAYHEINDFARKQGVKIINLTPGSFIDAFEREKVA